MTDTKAQIIILHVPVAAIFDAPNSDTLIRAYAKECLIPDAEPQRETYEAMEKVKAFRCFAAYSYTDVGNFLLGKDPSALIVGFISIIRAVMPHSGQLLATVESLFVDPAYRGTGAGAKLLSTAEQYAVDSGCVALTCMSRIGSAFDKVLSRREGYTLTHTQHTRWLSENGGQA
jgi:GNAT superfamily N-acetyltransferase